MCQGKDVWRYFFALLIGLASVGCIANGGPRPVRSNPQLISQPRAGGRPISANEPTSPVALDAPRPVSPTPAPAQPALLAQNAPQPSVPAAASPAPPADAPLVSPVVHQGPANPIASTTTSDPLAEVRRLHRTAVEQMSGVESYIARLRRREQINGKNQPEEVMSFKFRKRPWSVHFKWLSDPGKGREVLYVKGHYGDNIHTLLAAGDVPLMPAGMRFSLPPDDPKVLARSRHPITEAGIAALVDRIGIYIAAVERGDRRFGTLAYLGPQARTDYPSASGQPTTLEAIEQVLPAGAEPNLPRGGRRQCFFDPSNGLPVLVVTCDDRGQEVEYYAFDRMLFNVGLDDDDFNPDKLWRKR